VKTGIITTNTYLNHDTGQGHPERADRVTVVIDHLKKFKSKNLVWGKPKKFDLKYLEHAHEKNYLDDVTESFPKQGLNFLDGDTIVSPGSKDATRDAVGSILTAINGVMKKKYRNAFCAVRPPGHHAEKKKAMGFCVYNNVAVGAYYLLEKYNLSKVAIIDFDVHHGNGTQDIFYNNENVLYISSHQYPYYPGSGAADEKGIKDNIYNVPLNSGTQTHEFLNAYNDIFKKLKKFKPNFILLSAGFDAHKDDPLAQINLESKDYYTLTKRIMILAKELCDEKIVSILEGGYDLNALKESVGYHVKSLME
jgi:acetoin utilization deacetylase AcuC-like enzyme